MSQTELAEIGDLVAAAKGEPADLQLEVQAGPAPGVYLHEYRWYADSANLDIWDPATTPDSRVRRIKAWVNRGRNHQPRADFPPLDEPSQLAAWMARVCKRDLTRWHRIRAMAAPPRVPGEVPGSTSSTTSPPSKTAPAHPPGVVFDLTTVAALSAVDNLEQQRRVVAAAYQLYANALLAGAPDVDQRHRAYIAASAELRKTEKDTEELREGRGELIPRDRLAAELRRIHTAMAGSLRAALTDRRGQALTPEIEAAIITEFFRPLRSGDFGLPETAPASGPPPPAAA